MGRVCSTVVRALETRVTNLVAHLFSLATVMFLRGVLAAVPKAVISGFLLYMAGAMQLGG